MRSRITTRLRIKYWLAIPYCRLLETVRPSGTIIQVALENMFRFTSEVITLSKAQILLATCWKKVGLSLLLKMKGLSMHSTPSHLQGNMGLRKHPNMHIYIKVELTSRLILTMQNILPRSIRQCKK